MTKITAFLATLGLVVLLSTPVVAQPTTTPAMAAPVAMTAPAMRVAPRAPAMRPVPRPVARRPVARPAAMPAVMMTPAPVAAMPAPMTLVPAAMTPAAAAPVDSMTPAADAMAPAEAATPTTKKDSKGSVIGGGLLELLLKLIGILLGALIPILIAWIYKKLKLTDLQSKDIVDSMVLKAAMFGIGKAEEAAHKMRDNPMSGAEKLDMAISTANKYLIDSGLPKKGVDYLADVVESALGLDRKEGNGESKPEKKEEKPEEKKDESEEKSDDK